LAHRGKGRLVFDIQPATVKPFPPVPRSPDRMTHRFSADNRPDLFFTGHVNATLRYTPNGGNTGGTLRMTDGTHTANLALLGSYIAGNLSLAGDGSGGTVVIDAPFGPQQIVAAHPG
jgi:hypothetical protein